MSRLDERVVNLGRASGEAPRLSVLTPFHRYDPSPLIRRLAGAPAGVELVLLDDGSASAALLASVIATAETVGAPVRVVVWANNRGRAAARNRLLEEARGDYVLFLDADMIPDADDFLDRWLTLIEHKAPVIAFGGLSLRQATATPETALHYNLFSASDCRPAEGRAVSPSQFTASANLLVQKAFIAAHPFDQSFSGWGFEDTDWALSAAREHEILHIDNPATHAGLDDVDTLMRKSAEAGPNFARLAQKHPHAVARFGGYRIARALKALPAREKLREVCAWLARDPAGAAPMAIRRAALKLYRASHYAEHLA